TAAHFANEIEKTLRLAEINPDIFVKPHFSAFHLIIHYNVGNYLSHKPHKDAYRIAHIVMNYQMETLVKNVVDLTCVLIY
ncbi:hypothetical protein ACT453_49195, partial [Bacillus sp. D-CC]